MNAGKNNENKGTRKNRRRQSPARLLGRIIGFPLESQTASARMHVPSFAASWPRLAIA